MIASLRRYSVGPLVRMRRSPLGFVQALYAEQGDVARFSVAGTDAVLLSHPDAVRAVFFDQAEHLDKALSKRASVLLGDGLLNSIGETHRRRRRALQPAFGRERLMTAIEVIDESTREQLDALQPGVVNVDELMTRTTVHNAARALLGVADRDALAVEKLRGLSGLFDWLTHPLAPWLLRLPLPKTRAFLKSKDELERWLSELIAERRQHAGAGLLSTIAQSELSDDEVLREMITLFLAGFETVATCLTWSMWLLARRPEIQSALVDEVSSATTLHDREQAPKLFRFVDESLRLFPPIWLISRRAMRDVHIAGAHVDEGTIVLLSPFLMQRDPRFFDDPDTFFPERPPPRHPDAFQPFGAGARKCIGDRFALAQVRVVIGQMLSAFSLSALDTAAPAFKPTITLRSDGPVKLRLEARRAH